MARAVKTVDGGSKQMERRAKVANDNIGKAFAGGALNQGIDTFTSRAPAAVASLQGVSAAGTAAAVAVGAVMTAFSGAREAARFADDIADTANKLHVTTDALQEYRYAIRAAGGDEQGADQALEAFSVTLGNAQRGMVKAQKAFVQLGFSKEQIAQMTDADSALRAVAERINELPLTQQDALIKALGLEGLKPLLQDGVAEMERLRQEAHKVGVVMDADLVARGAALNDEFETVAKVIDVQLKSALVDLGPVLVDLLKLVAGLARAAADVADAFRDIEHKSVKGLQDRRAQLSEEATRTGTRQLAGSKLSKPEQQRLARINGQIADIDAQLASRSQRTATPVTPTRTLVDTSGGGRSGKAKTTRDSTAQRTAEVENALNDAERDLLQAWNGLVQGADQRADISKQILDVEQQMLNDRIDKQQADIKADEGLTKAKKDELVASLEIVRTEQGKVDQLKRELIDRELAADKARDAADLTNAEIDSRQETIQALIGLAKTAAERRVLEYKLLDLAEQRAQAELEVIAATRGTASVEYQIAKKKLGDLQANRGMREDTVRQQTMGPLEAFIDANDAAKNLGTTLQTTLVQGLDQAADAAAKAALEGESLAEALSNIFAGMAQDLLSSAFRSAGATAVDTLKNAFLKSLPGFASGTNRAPGGPALVGERGPEIVNLPRGAQVIPNDVLRAIAKRPAVSAPVVQEGDKAVYMNITTPNADSFRRSQRQIMTAQKRGLQSV